MKVLKNPKHEFWKDWKCDLIHEMTCERCKAELKVTILDVRVTRRYVDYGHNKCFYHVQCPCCGCRLSLPELSPEVKRRVSRLEDNG